MTKPNEFFNKKYSDESSVDIVQDIEWAMEEIADELEYNDDGFANGTFTVTITYNPEIPQETKDLKHFFDGE